MTKPTSIIPSGNAFRLLGIFGLLAPFLTFGVAVSDLAAEIKIIALTAIAVLYSLLFWYVIKKGNMREASENRLQDGSFGHKGGVEIEDRGLAGLDEANEFFGASLNRADMFRLVSARINDIVPITASLLFVSNSAAESIKIAATFGETSGEIIGTDLPVETGLAGLAYLSGEIEIGLHQDGQSDPISRLVSGDFRSAAAIPLIHDGNVFCIFEAFTKNSLGSQQEAVELFESIRTRITPIFLGSFAADRSLSNALSDSVTDLPNERAFFLVLENQLAESIRYRDERPLTVIALDIKGFEAVNQRFGHSTGDKLLAYIANRIQAKLRQMDFLARSINDEFLVILPKATEQIAAEVVERIRLGIAENTFHVDEEFVPVSLNFGSATFWQDGETPEQLVRHAQFRKQQNKAQDPGNVVWFPKEYVN